MSAPYSTARAPERRRPAMVCLNCRQQNIKCVSSEHPPPSPCARCTRKNLICQYVAVSTEDAPTAAPRPAPHSASSFGPAPALPYTAPPPMNSYPRYSGGTPYPSLSLSGTPPPDEQPPRRPAPHAHAHAYASHPLPSGVPAYGAGAGYSAASPYMPPYAPNVSGRGQPQWPAVQPGVAPGPGYAYPPGYGQMPMPFFADTSMQEQQQHDWRNLRG
ncbi:hypothetical protein GGX14DRAFT_620966 [Mycena pura]|uniref:Zn(2)-C6 fungal-type domain-containing protein n=1 Tax=Mycena pura TaxID=153505 RepID=A0AAD6VPA7_9AGAR|nr:hypothetical protein GGX14DRAFT_620966 [Mycena pura]